MNTIPVCPYCGEPLGGPVVGESLKGEVAYRYKAAGLSWAHVATQMGGSKGGLHTLAKGWALRRGKPWPPEWLDE